MAIVQHLIVEQFGTHVGKYSGRLKVTKKGETLVQAPLLHLESVTIASRGVSLSADAVRACTERGIPIHFISSRGAAYASLYSAGLTGTVLTRRAQLAAYGDARALHLAEAFALGKIENQARLLLYLSKNRKTKEPAVYKRLRQQAAAVRDHLAEVERVTRRARAAGETLDDARGALLAAEGRAAQAYWQGVRAVVPDTLEWPGREGRGARDPLNSALNYGYAILYSAVERALVLAGLDPYGGFVHTDRPGKPSLVLDLIEEFRAAVVDRTVLGLVNLGVALDQDERGYLVEGARRTLAEKVLARLETRERHEKKRHALRAILQMQARHLATYVRGERDGYAPFIARW